MRGTSSNGSVAHKRGWEELQLCKGHHYMGYVVTKQFILEWLYSGFTCISHSVSVWNRFPHKVIIQFNRQLSDWYQNSHIAVSPSVFFDAPTGVSNVKNVQIWRKVKWLCLKGTSHTLPRIYTDVIWRDPRESGVTAVLCLWQHRKLACTGFTCLSAATLPNTSTWHSWQFASLRSKNCQTARIFLHREKCCVVSETQLFNGSTGGLRMSGRETSVAAPLYNLTGGSAPILIQRKRSKRDVLVYSSGCCRRLLFSVVSRHLWGERRA